MLKNPYPILLALCALLISLNTTVNAAPITWMLQDVVFDDGGAASGSYIYDASTNQLSNISIITTPGSNPDYMGETYTFNWPSDSTFLIATAEGSGADMTDEYIFHFILDGSMSDAGGTISIQTGSENICLFSYCSANPDNERSIISGYVSTIPIPAAVWLFGSGLIGLIGVARRKAHA